MTKFSQWLKAVRLFAGNFPLTTGQPVWTEGDAAALRKFLVTDAGQKLVLSIRYQEQAMNASAVMKAAHHSKADYACGFAAGFRASAAWFNSLSAHSEPSSEKVPDAHSTMGADELSETYAP